MICPNCNMEFEGTVCPLCGQAVPEADKASVPSPPQGPKRAGRSVLGKVLNFLLISLIVIWTLFVSLMAAYASRENPDFSHVLWIIAWLPAAFYMAFRFLLPAISRQQLKMRGIDPSTVKEPVKEMDRFHREQRKQQEAEAWRQEQARRQRLADNRANGIPMCPRCKSTAIQARDGRTFSLSQAMIGQALFGESGAAMGVNAGNRKKIEMVCLNCGRHWTMKLK